MNKSSPKYSKSLFNVSTLELIRQIVEESSTAALKVLLDTRRLFHVSDKSPLLLPEYLLVLKDRSAAQNCLNSARNRDESACCSYDLTLAKYSNLPDSGETIKTGDCLPIGSNADCRYYYRALLKIYKNQETSKDTKNSFQEEFDVGKIFQSLVYRNFLRSKKECERHTPFTVRYTWVVGNRRIYLYYPSFITVGEFKIWLQACTKEIRVDASDAQPRIQELIERDLGRCRQIPLDETILDRTLEATQPASALEAREGQYFVSKLSEAVAREKSERIADLRPAIGKLGKVAVKDLVLQIFSELDQEDYQLTRMAEKYGISKAALSRFAGSKWSEKAEASDEVEIPDLWKNTAQVLAADSTFMDTVASSGFAGNLERVLRRIEDRRGENNG